MYEEIILGISSAKQYYSSKEMGDWEEKHWEHNVGSEVAIRRCRKESSEQDWILFMVFDSRRTLYLNSAL